MRHRVILLLAAMVVSAASFATERADVGEQPAGLSKKELRRTMRGYKAFYEAGYEFCDAEDEEIVLVGGSLIIGDKEYPRDPIVIPPNETIWDGGVCPLYNFCNKLSFATSQGFQFNNFFYLGAGIGLDYYVNPQLRKVSIPLFADARVNFLNKRFSPFFDFRLGGSIGDLTGVFTNFQLGLRVGLPENHAVYAAAEVCLQTDVNFYQLNKSTATYGFKLGYEF